MDQNQTFLFSASANKNRDIERTNHTTQRKDINNKIEYIHSYTSDMESGVTLADIMKEETLQRNCTKVGIVYIARTANETEQERDARHHQLQLAIKSKRRIENKSQRRPDKERRLKENNVHAQRRHRANFSPEQQANARRINTASRQQQRASLSSKQQDHARRINTATRQQQRANLSPATRSCTTNQRCIHATTACKSLTRATRSSVSQTVYRCTRHGQQQRFVEISWN